MLTTRQGHTPLTPQQAAAPAATSAGAAEVVSILDAPIVVVTTADRGDSAGCLVEFSAQVSMDPQRYLVAISPKNATFRIACRADRIAVHLLSRDQLGLARLFGETTGDSVDKFGLCAWTRVDGVPVLDAAPAWFVGRVLHQWPLGDHVGFLLGFLRGTASAVASPLTASDVKGLSAAHQA